MRKSAKSMGPKNRKFSDLPALNFGNFLYVIILYK